jgi:hypothetical protein
MMKFILAVMIVIEVGTAAAAQLFITQPSEGVPLLTMLPADAATVADYYKQKVYDPADEKIGEIVDLVIEKSGYVPAVIIAVSAFLALSGPSTLQFHLPRCKSIRKSTRSTSFWTRISGR